MSQTGHQEGRGPFIKVIAFALGRWRRQRFLVSLISALFLVQTLADVLMPLYAGKLIDAISSASTDLATARSGALIAPGLMVRLALLGVAARHGAFIGIARFSLEIMTDVARSTFWRIQRFSTDWHANNFVGSTVRKITRGMWAFESATNGHASAADESSPLLHPRAKTIRRARPSLARTARLPSWQEERSIQICLRK